MKAQWLLGSFIIATTLVSCLSLDRHHSYRKKNKCCGIVKCAMHRKSNMRKHKAVTTGKRSVRKKAKRIKNGY